MKPIVMALAAILVGALGSSCTSLSVSERDVYKPQPGAELTAFALSPQSRRDYTLEPQTILAADGTRLTGTLLRRSGAERTILYFGGNLFTVSGRGPGLAERLAPLNANILFVDFRGYGASVPGPINSDALLDDGLAVFDHLTKLPGIRPDRIYVHGHSLGSFFAAHVAANRSTAGVILESPATNAQAVVRGQVPLWARGVIRVDLSESLKGQDNLVTVKFIDEKLLILVGAQDKLTPPRFSRELLKTSTLPASRKQLVIFKDADHTNVLAQATSIEAYRGFLDQPG